MFKNCVSGLEMPQMPNIFFYQTFYKICCLQHICCVRPQSTVKDAWHQRSEKLFLPNHVPPVPPFSGWNDPLCKFLCSTVTSTITFQPSTFTFRTFVWNRGTFIVPVSVSPNFSPQNPLYRT